MFIDISNVYVSYYFDRREIDDVAHPVSRLVSPYARRYIPTILIGKLKGSSSSPHIRVSTLKYTLDNFSRSGVDFATVL